jgi:hypothetical protein
MQKTKEVEEIGYKSVGIGTISVFFRDVGYISSFSRSYVRILNFGCETS